jgi:hypothetical protein
MADTVEVDVGVGLGVGVAVDDEQAARTDMVIIDASKNRYLRLIKEISLMWRCLLFP